MTIADFTIDTASVLVDAIRTGLGPRDLPPLTPGEAGSAGPYDALPVEVAAILDLCRDARARALVLAKTGDVAAAAALVESARQQSLDADLPDLVGLREAAFHAGTASYIAYRDGDYSRAEEIIAKGVAANSEAVEVHGDDGAAVHRIRLLLNLVRVQWRSGDVRAAMSQARAILDDIARDGPLGGRAMLELLTVEQIAEIAQTTDRTTRATVVDAVGSHLRGAGASRSGRGHAYLRALVATNDGDATAAAEALADLFERGPAGSRPLWRAALALVDELLAAGLLECSSELETELARAAASRPPQMANFFGK
jgi:hypothetical protein